MAGINRPGRICKQVPRISGYLCISLAIIAVILARGVAATPGGIDVSGFSVTDTPGVIPGYWQPISFRTIPQATRYRLEHDPHHGPVIRADAKNSASLLSRTLDIDPANYPELSWSWKISRPFRDSSLTDPDGDDFPARLLVSFGSFPPGSSIPEATLCYVWAGTEGVGTRVQSPALGGLTTIVASNNTGGTDQWRVVRRNIVQDFRTAYGTEPQRIQAISLMTDTDDTNSHISAWYGPILLSPLTNSHP